MWATRQVDPFEGTFYPTVTFHLHIRRRSLYYFVNVLIPCVLISMLTVLSFSLPPESGEKLSFGTFYHNGELFFQDHHSSAQYFKVISAFCMDFIKLLRHILELLVDGGY